MATTITPRMMIMGRLLLVHRLIAAVSCVAVLQVKFGRRNSSRMFASPNQATHPPPRAPLANRTLARNLAQYGQSRWMAEKAKL